MLLLKHQVFMGKYNIAVCLSHRGLPAHSWRTQTGKKTLKLVSCQSGLCVRASVYISDTSRCGPPPPLHGRSPEDPLETQVFCLMMEEIFQMSLHSQVVTLLILEVFSVQGCRFCRANRDVFWRHRGSGVSGWLIVFWKASCCSCIRMRLACCRSASRSSAVCRLHTHTHTHGERKGIMVLLSLRFPFSGFSNTGLYCIFF